MAHVIFWFGAVCTVGMLVIPWLAKTRGKALMEWMIQFLGAAACTATLAEYFPTFTEPLQGCSVWWWAVQWITFIGGFVIAITRPSKRDLQQQTVA